MLTLNDSELDDKNLFSAVDAMTFVESVHFDVEMFALFVCLCCLSQLQLRLRAEQSKLLY